MPSYETVILALIGLAIGSFLNVVAHRLPRGESVVAPPSHCPGCGKRIASRDNIPVLSWVLLRGRCRTCANPISVRYPIVEALTSALFVACGYRFAPSLIPLAAFCLFFAALVVISAIDLATMKIPNRVVFPAMGATVILLACEALTSGSWTRFWQAAIGGSCAFAVFTAICLVLPRGMGFGDAKLSGLIGACLGWVGLWEVIVGFFLAFAISAVVSLPLLVVGRIGRKTKIPFGPFLAAGAVLGVLFGHAIVKVWLGKK